MDAADVPAARKLVPILERKAGRLLVNGFPTGVEVCLRDGPRRPVPGDLRQPRDLGRHDGDQRFLRPVCYQDFPADLLPEALADSNPLESSGVAAMARSRAQLSAPDWRHRMKNGRGGELPGHPFTVGA